MTMGSSHYVIAMLDVQWMYYVNHNFYSDIPNNYLYYYFHRFGELTAWENERPEEDVRWPLRTKTIQSKFLTAWN